MRVFPPLKPGHPLIGDTCPICKQPFFAYQRTIILTANDPVKVSTLPAVPVHTSCGLRGFKSKVGEIERIKEGDASPYLVLTVDGKQWTLQEAGFD